MVSLLIAAGEYLLPSLNPASTFVASDCNGPGIMFQADPGSLI